MERGDEGEPNLVRDTIWAYSNLENRADVWNALWAI